MSEIRNRDEESLKDAIFVGVNLLSSAGKLNELGGEIDKSGQRRRKKERSEIQEGIGVHGEKRRWRPSEIPHPYFLSPTSSCRGLLDRAQEVYGYHPDGPLRIPCSVDDFLEAEDDTRW
ncbi:hypothetical protein K1719_006350 [Acacia pycnantha]|nr:hypothetical protein K1719_006350 [Acacia pycnantha]